MKLKPSAPQAQVLEFYSANGEDVYFDYVICTLPFTKLRQVTHSISTASAPPNAWPLTPSAMAPTPKFFWVFIKQLWRELGFSGQVFSDTSVQLAWDNSQLQSGEAGGLTVFTGGATPPTCRQPQACAGPGVPAPAKQSLPQPAAVL